MNTTTTNTTKTIEQLKTLLFLEQEERKLLAAELHGIKAGVNVAILKLNIALKNTKKALNSADEIEEAVKFLNEYLIDFREPYKRLYPAFVETHGLQSSLKALVADIHKTGKIEIIYLPEDGEMVSNNMPKQTAIYKICYHIIELYTLCKKPRMDMKLFWQQNRLGIAFNSKSTELSSELAIGVAEKREIIVAQLVWLNALIDKHTDWNSKIKISFEL